MPCDRSRYPDNWPAIRARILARACNCCERCGVPNYAVGKRDREGTFHEAERAIWPEVLAQGGIRIVLTVAHVDNPDPMDCRDENLQALCQRCHLRLDATMHGRNAAATRRARRTAGQLELGL